MRFYRIQLLLTLPSVLWHCWLGDRKGIRPVKKVGCWFVGGNNFTGALHVSCHYHLHHPWSNKIQDGDILVPSYRGCPGKWPLNECLVSCFWQMEKVMESSTFVYLFTCLHNNFTKLWTYLDKIFVVDADFEHPACRELRKAYAPTPYLVSFTKNCLTLGMLRSKRLLISIIKLLWMNKHNGRAFQMCGFSDLPMWHGSCQFYQM